MKATVILSDDEYVEYDDCHGVINTGGDLMIVNNTDDVVAEYFHNGWKSVTTFA